MTKATFQKLRTYVKRSALQRGYVAEVIHGSQHQSGWPAMFLFRKDVGLVWVQLRSSDAHVLSENKLARFNHWSARGAKIYCITGTDEADNWEEIIKGPANWAFARYKDNGDRQALCANFELPEPDIQRGPEGVIAQAIKEQLQRQNWVCAKTFGNKYQVGFPDFYAIDPRGQSYWIEVKTERGKLEASQYAKFQKWFKLGLEVWVLTAPDQLELLEQPANWWQFPRKTWRKSVK